MNDVNSAADGVALIHVAFVAFVVGGFIFLVAGDLLDTRWARSRVFRSIHLLAVTYTLVRTWVGGACPLRTLEDHLRQSAPTPPAASADPIATWSHRLFFRGADHSI